MCQGDWFVLGREFFHEKKSFPNAAETDKREDKESLI